MLNCTGQEELGGEVPHGLQRSRKPIIVLQGEGSEDMPECSAPQGSPLASTRLGGGTQVGSKCSEIYVAPGSPDSPTDFYQSTSLQWLKNKTKETKSVLHTQSLRTLQQQHVAIPGREKSVEERGPCQEQR